MAAPVFDHTGVPVMVLSVCGPLERFRGRVDELSRTSWSPSPMT